MTMSSTNMGHCHTTVWGNIQRMLRASASKGSVPDDEAEAEEEDDREDG